ncbi:MULTISPECIES: DUF2922 domain-containing protein [Nosocomiicoccus]|uniref:DUF2922 domain-containing protein n=1 Tax=Nosocomiicoccus TaxID=489909 RepID=UPI0004012EAC|nr:MULTISPECIES: DUF2922 domain-containing protein [Nosocomiicoccus]OFL48103.1 hypothetical protein HMPREF2767_08405 [Nosocomiicoccus sp. HMSC067E10]OFS62903.1 hypothetical protein HMPREF3177_04395 [Nosocomiicoccus sp. HMSC09A07]
MSRKLILQFETEYEGVFNFTINEPKDGLSQEEVELEAQKIIDSKALISKDGAPVRLKSAKIVTQDVETLV